MDKKYELQRPSKTTNTSSPWIVDILRLIFSFSSDDLSQLTNYCLVSSTWYSEAIRIVWREPIFQTQASFQRFKQAICKNQYLASLVYVLDLQDYRYFVLKYATSLLPYLPNLNSIRFPQAIPISKNILSISPNCPFSALKVLNYVEIYSSDVDDLRFLESILRHCTHLEKLGLILKDTEDWELPTDIQPIASLKWLEIAGLELTEPLLRSLLTLTPNLTRLEIFTGSPPTNFISTIVNCCQQLDHLHFEFEYAEDDVLWELSNDNVRNTTSRLKHFSLIYNQVVYDIPEEWMESLWRSLTSLEVLRLWRVELSDTMIHSLSKMPIPKLRSLDICSTSVVESNSVEAWEEFFVSCGGQLTQLSISHSLLPARVGQIIAKYCVKLEELTIRSCKFTDASVVAVVEHCGDTLKKIKLYDTSFTEASLRAICDQCTKLEELVLFRTEHWLQPFDTTPLISYIAEHGYFLRSLCIRGWKATNDLLNSLADYGPNLQELDFENETELEDSVLQRVMACCQLRQLNITTQNDCAGLTPELIESVDKYYVFAKRLQNPLSLDMETIYGMLYSNQ
ncbi:hypothetical protein K7432_006885 [Basidiobolus ranarum]|uniref:F-box domain-containing protein n=1 Tax=Basidiobolus ranarum TaxID=34480 RepID=A0ABR2WU74_9FUNG